MRSLFVSYTVIKTAYGKVPVYYQVVDNGYAIYATLGGYALVSIITDPSDVSDFTSNFLAQSILVTSEDDALAEGATFTGTSGPSNFIHLNSTITTNGSTILTGFGEKEIQLIVNITAAPTGSSPTIQFTIQQVDPGDQTTLFGSTASTSVINSTGVYTAILHDTSSGAVHVSWTVGGGTPSFTGVYTTVLSKVGSPTQPGGAIQVSGTVTSNIGTTGGLTLDATLTGGTQTTRVTDGTNTAAVKAASTAPLATDPALVVAISPNSSITATNPSVGATGSAVPASATQIGGSDGTNLQTTRVFDADSGAGTQYVLGTVLRKSASGGSVEAGTSSDPLRIDPTGTTTQPVSGTVTANIGTSGSLALDATLTGGAQTTRITDGTNTAAVKAASTAPLATDPALVVSISPNSTLTAVNPSVGANNAAAPSSSTQVGGTDGTNLQASHVFDTDTGGGTQYVLGTVLRKSASGGSVEAGTASDPLRIDPTGTTTQPVSDGGGSLTIDTTQLPAALVGGRLDTNVGAWLGSTNPTVGQKAMADSLPVVIAFDQSAFPTLLTPTDNASIGPLNALNANVSVDVVASTGVAIIAGTLVGTIVPEISLDGGTTWVATVFVSPAGVKSPSLSGTFNANVAYDIELVGGVSQARVRVSVYTSGTATAWVRSKQGLPSTETGLTDAELRATAVPVSGTVTSNIGTTGGLALDATLTGGTTKAIIRGGTKGATTPADVTSTAEGADHQALDVQIYHGGVAKDPTQIRALTNADVVSAEVTKWIGSTAPTVGQKTMANSLPVAIASDQSAVTVTGTVTATNPSVGSTGSAVPASATQIGGSDGTNLQAPRVFDADSGAGTQYVLGTVLRKSASGGSVEAGTSSDPLRVDPTGTTTQPVSAASLPLPAGAATEATLAALGGKKDAGNSTATPLGSNAVFTGTYSSCIGYDQIQVYVSTDQSSAVDGIQVFWDYDGTGANAFVDLEQHFTYSPDGWALFVIRIRAPFFKIKYTNAVSAQAVFGLATVLKLVSPDATVLPGQGTTTDTAYEQDRAMLVAGVGVGVVNVVGVDATGAVSTDVAKWLGSSAPSVGQKISDNSVPVVIAADQSAVPVSGTVTANQGTAAALSGGWPVKVTDGTNIQPTGDAVGRAIFEKITDGTNTAAVKAASTAATATDPSLVVALSPNSSAAIHSDRNSTGNTITAGGQNVSFSTQGTGTASIQLTGTWSATVVFEASVDSGNNYVSIPVHPAAGGASVTSATANGDFQVASSGFTNIRIRSTSFTSGTINITINAGVGSSFVRAAQGNPNPVANAWPVQVTDLTNTMPTMDVVGRAGFIKVTDGTTTAVVKAASTAAGVTDPALVVAVSPNNTIPTNVSQFGGSAVVTGTGTSGAGIPRVTVSSDSSLASIPLASDRTASGNITGVGQTRTISTQGAGNVAIQITGTFVLTLQFEATVDGSNWFSILGYTVPGSSPLGAVGSSSATSTGSWNAPCAGYNQIRVRSSAYTSGTATINFEAGPGVMPLVGADRALSGSIGGVGQQTQVAAAGASQIGFQLAGSWTASLIFEGTLDNTTWYTIPAFQVGGAAISTLSNSGTHNGLYFVPCSGFLKIRLRCAAYTSGTATVTTEASSAAIVPALTGYVDPNNTTNTVLTSNQQYVGAYTGVGAFDVLYVYVFADQSSAANGLQVQWSQDGSIPTQSDVDQRYTYSNVYYTTYPFRIRGPYYRILYTNGSSDQTSFTLTSVLKASSPDSTVLPGQIEGQYEIVRPTAIAGKDSTGAYRAVRSGTDGNIATNRTASGNFSGVGSITLSSDGLSAVGIQLTGTWVGTVAFEGSVDGSNYFSVPAHAITSTGGASPVTSASANGQWIAGVAGLISFRVRCTVFTSGTIVTSIVGTPGTTSETINPAVTITSPAAGAAGLYAFVSPFGTLRTSSEGPALFHDNFDAATFDTTNTWVTNANSGGSVAPVSGQATFTVGTTASAFTELYSQASLPTSGLGFLVFGCVVKLEVAAITNNHRFWGFGVTGAATSEQLLNAVGFEVETDGILYGVVYSNGARTAQALTKPTDGAQHRYVVLMRGDLIFWYQDSLEVPVASLSYSAPNVTTLPIRFHCFNLASPPGSAPTFTVTGVGVQDTTPSSIALSDGAYPWRKASVKPASTAATASDSSLVVAVSPNTPVAAVPTSDAYQSDDLSILRQLMEALLVEHQVTNLLLAKLVSSAGVPIRQEELDSVKVVKGQVN